MFMIAKDDPITQWNSVPVEDLKRNKNFLLAFSDAGGHCEWYYSDEKKQKYLRYTPQVVLLYFDLISAQLK